MDSKAEQVDARCSWTRVAGQELGQLVATRISEEDVFEKPDLDDVVNEERAVLFSNNEGPTVPCELQFQILPRFKIAAITLVCSTSKVEIFVGPSQEYLETKHGTAVEPDDSDVPIRPYRYDVEIDRSGIADITLKLLTSAKEICVFGTMLHIAPNPNGITTQLQKPINIARMQELLQKGGLQSKQDNDLMLEKFVSLKNNINDLHDKLELLEKSIAKRLDDFEAKQAAKLDRILELLQQKM
ncbi:CG11882 [Drosophila busckii]|uniref:CG11882 n=1 Tax=Drosophila busckii TaxID=30019 RepID=A0A0M5J983_DROBS|nr:uncharacterized protein LOC108603905 [Drosophila busckii]ALC46411.1 CG11882 [Drosophila busckii]